jgi:peptidoglycan/LPS O-acetylase OafA/YrhL
MSAVTTLAATVVATVGALALYRYAERRSRPLREAISEMRRTARRAKSTAVIDYEQDPESGVFKPKDTIGR